MVYDSADNLAAGNITELPSHEKEFAAAPFPAAFARQLLAILGHWVVEGRFDIPVDESLNKAFPEIKTLSVRDVLLRRDVIE